MDTIKDNLIDIYASILKQEKVVVFAIEDEEAIGVITENVSGDADWNVELLEHSPSGRYYPVDGGWFTGEEKDAIKFLIDMYEDQIAKLLQKYSQEGVQE